MTEKIPSNEVLDSESVGSVHPTTTIERVIDAIPSGASIIAFVGLLGTLSVCICILFSNNENLMEYRSGAWALISGFAGACIAHFFGDGKRPPS